MNEISDDILLAHLNLLLDTITQDIMAAEDDFQRLNVAITGGFRLLSEGNTSTLVALYGSPQDLVAYLLKIIEDIRKNLHARQVEMKSALVKAIEITRNS